MGRSQTEIDLPSQQLLSGSRTSSNRYGSNPHLSLSTAACQQQIHRPSGALGTQVTEEQKLEPSLQNLHIHIHLGPARNQEEPAMGLSYNVYLNSDKIFGCKTCKTHLASHDSIISRVGPLFLPLQLSYEPSSHPTLPSPNYFPSFLS